MSERKDTKPASNSEPFVLPEEVAGLRVREVCHSDLVLLRDIKHPLVDRLTKALKQDQKPVEFTDDQGIETIFLFTSEAATVHKWAREQPREQLAANFRARALEQIAYKLGPLDVKILMALVERSVVRGFTLPKKG